MNVYEKLKKIRKPVLIAVYCNGYLSKFRILRPNGECTWNYIDHDTSLSKKYYKLENDELFTARSCFVSEYKQPSLIKTVEAMKRYDNSVTFNTYNIQLVGTIDL
jgi:hypothetical protein